MILVVSSIMIIVTIISTVISTVIGTVIGTVISTVVAAVISTVIIRSSSCNQVVCDFVISYVKAPGNISKASRGGLARDPTDKCQNHFAWRASWVTEPAMHLQAPTACRGHYCALRTSKTASG